MKRITFFYLLFFVASSSFFYPQISTRKGWWKFDDQTNPLKAEIGFGNDLQLVGTHQTIAGPDSQNNAVKIGPGSYYKLYHGIQPNGGGVRVNEYSIQIDFRIPELNIWHCFFQTDTTNGSDGDCFINPSGNIGVGVTGYSEHTIVTNEWYRLVIVVQNGTQYKYYLDGQLFNDGANQAIDGRFALDNLLLIFDDDDGEDGVIDCAEIAIWDHALTAQEVFALGSFHEIDVTPPNPVSDLSVSPLEYQNLVIWTDVPGENGEVYDIYYSEKPITDITKAEVLTLGIPENTQAKEQILRSAGTDQDLTYYYAIVCKDYAGNYSEPFYLNTPTINKGKGVPTIANSAPANFKADGDLAEWASVPQFRIIFSEGTGFPAVNGSFDGDADISGIAYFAMDKDNFYFAADITDDIYSWKATNDPWMNDCVDLFIGLFDSHRTFFDSYERGATPHYQIRFDQERVTTFYSDSLLLLGPNYYFTEKFPTGYMFEAKIPFVDIAKKRNYYYTGAKDSVFVPQEGMKIPVDFSINDADATGDREVVFTYSPYNEDQSWQDPTRWLWTWIGNKMIPDDVNDTKIINSYNLAQNYPNPFNPSTKITYSLQNPELVTLKIFDVLGREVATLVNQYQTAGNHTVSFNAGSLGSGIYFYKIEAGSFQSVKKLMLLK
ncbi:MAG: T9SS type A sorting domain-containing protein [Ignavibacteriales bacterium]|nr:T9SS type A sorting domain-containing protein [Ignavibacteriales bacterium]